jgi:hypothetical protein
MICFFSDVFIVCDFRITSKSSKWQRAVNKWLNYVNELERRHSFMLEDILYGLQLQFIGTIKHIVICNGVDRVDVLDTSSENNGQDRGWDCHLSETYFKFVLYAEETT